MQRLTTAILLLVAVAGCEAENHFARAFEIETMAQTIGGPAAVARPGDLLLENDRIRAVIHGRHNSRSVAPVANGSLVDLDIQRPHHRYGVGKGEDAFYEMGPMVNLKVNASTEITHGACDEVGDAPCPEQNNACVRVSASGKGDDIIGVIGLLDLAIRREADGKKVYDPAKLRITTDYDLCPGEPYIRIATTARFDDAKEPVPLEMEEFRTRVGLLDVLLGENTGKDCAKDPCPAGQSCDDLLIPLSLGTFNTEMKRCRKPEQKLAGVLAGDLMLFSGKVSVFVPGAGFDHESYIRSLFDTGGDVFSNPLSLQTVVAVGDGVSYAYFNRGGQVMIPVFSETFTATMTNRFACKRSDPECLKGRKVRFRRFVSVGQGDAASALAGFYKVQGISHGKIEGHVVDARHREPISDMNVFVFKLPAAWASLTDDEIGRKTLEQLMAQHARETATKENPDGTAGIISHFRTDVGLDRVADGSFSGPLPVAGPSGISCPSFECRYLLVARNQERGASGVYPVTVRANEISRVTLVAGHGGALEFDVQDPSGRPLPSKLTIGHCFPECGRDADCAEGQACDVKTRLCRPAGGYAGPQSCRPDQRWDGKTCACSKLGLLPLSLRGHRYADGTVHVAQSATGRGRLELPPGTYQVLASRGIEYETRRKFVTLVDGVERRFKAVIPRSVDTEGWISADFHVHGPGSPDSGLDHRTRVTSYAAEGVELLTATDHDTLTDYRPAIYQLGLQDWIKSQVGVEVSPLDYGHFIGFPLRFDENAELNGSFHWRTDDEMAKDPDLPDWKNLNPLQIFKNLRNMGTLGVDRTVVFVAHFYDHFTFYGVDPFSLELPAFSITALFNKVLLPASFSPEFDALEAFNGKNLDIIRRPTFKEIRDYNVKLARALEEGAKLPYDERQRSYLEISAAAQRAFLERTPEEQKASLAFNNPTFQCRCTYDGECGGGFICDDATGACVSSCGDDSHCDAKLVAAGREGCKQRGTFDPDRKTCQRLARLCSKSADCDSWSGAAEACTAGKCELPCQQDKDCKDTLRPRCDVKAGVCTAAATPLGVDPCPPLRGTLDDWFQLLNHGVRRTVLGNSDSHDTYGVEAGIPRNYVRSSTDLPNRITPGEVADQIHAARSFATYGPFVELTVNESTLGGTVTIENSEQVTLKLRVQSPRWFDVDRIEVYRNGELIKTITGSEECDDRSSCIKVPNDGVVNFDGTVTDTPKQDAWYVALVMGLDGKTLAPVYSSTPVARLGIFELIQRLTPLLPPLRALRMPLSPSMTVVRPYAVTNPIWVDVGGDGLTPLREPPTFWIPETKPGTSTSKLTQGHTHTHDDGSTHSHGPVEQEHDHSVGLGRFKADAAQIRQLARDGVITPTVLQHALDQLRFIGR
jgi:hypothetical protein